MKSVQIQKDEKRLENTHSLMLSFVNEAVNQELKQNADELERIVGNYSRMRYPRMIDYPNPPGNLYSREDAEKAIDLAKAIVKAIDEKYF